MAGLTPEDFTEEEIGRLTEIAKVPEKFLNLSVFERRQFVADWVCAFPERHKQEAWLISETTNGKEVLAESIGENACGTAACVAGWTTLFAGYVPEMVSFDEFVGASARECSNGTYIERIGYKAAELLGLYGGARADLFQAYNSKATIRRIVAELNEGNIDH
jgi:hypothetical protein